MPLSNTTKKGVIGQAHRKKGERKKGEKKGERGGPIG